LIGITAGCSSGTEELSQEQAGQSSHAVRCENKNESACISNPHCEPVYVSSNCICAAVPCYIDERTGDEICPPCDCPDDEAGFAGCRERDPCESLTEDECVSNPDCSPFYGHVDGTVPDYCQPPNSGGGSEPGDPNTDAAGANTDPAMRPCEPGDVEFLGCYSAPACPPVCAIWCEYGNVLDENGCATCECNPPPNDCENLSEDECLDRRGCAPVYEVDAQGGTTGGTPGTDPDASGGGSNTDPTDPNQDPAVCSDGTVPENGVCQAPPEPPPPCDPTTNSDCCDEAGNGDCWQPRYAGCYPVPVSCYELSEDECHGDPGCEPEYGVLPCPEPTCPAGDPNCPPDDGTDWQCDPNVVEFLGCHPIQEECLLDFVCPNGQAPQGPNCECWDECTDAAGNTWNCECPLDFVCQDGSLPQGPNCECPPPSCDTATGEPCGCVTADGQVIPPGTAFPSPDGCNTCWCEDSGLVTCTAMACECPLDFVCQDGSLPQGPNCECPPPSCDTSTGEPCGCVTAAGQVIPPGSAFPSPDGCNTCWCEENGLVVCTEIACECPLDFVCQDGSLPQGANCECPPPVCDTATGQDCACIGPDGRPIAPGESFPAPDGCNTCYCDANGGIACTEMACECPLDFVCADGSQPQGANCECPPPPTCDNTAGLPCECVTPDGQLVPPGTTFEAGDGCNTCVCDQNGQISCTEIACSNGG
jgi:hypothetical protein